MIILFLNVKYTDNDILIWEEVEEVEVDDCLTAYAKCYEHWEFRNIDQLHYLNNTNYSLYLSS